MKKKTLKGILSEYARTELLWSAIDCWREATSGGKEDDWTYMRCEACPDKRKEMCEMFQRAIQKKN